LCSNKALQDERNTFVTEKAMFDRLYLVPGLVPICALFHHALGAHVPTAHAPAISRFL